MYIKRQLAATKLPIPRKGTTYIARASSNLFNSVPVVIAIREMLGLAKTAAEVKKMINHRVIQINGRNVLDYREPICLFNLLKADKTYFLTLLPTGKFSFQQTSSSDRLCKVIGKKLLNKNQIQINLHDGTNFISQDKISIGDSVYLDKSKKVKKHISLGKDKEVFIISGRYIGLKGKIKSVDNGKVGLILYEDKKETELNKSQVVVL